MAKQKTIAKEIVFSGKGLHTGNLAEVKLKPALPNTGIKFVRVDVGKKPVVIPANYRNVKDVKRGTTLGIDNVVVCTVEHILSALHGLEIDNIEIELNNNELPIFDGSAIEFVKYILKAEIVEQNCERKYIVIKEPIIYSGSNNLTEIKAYPSDKLVIDCSIQYDHPIVNKQEYCFVFNTENFINLIAPSKTFCFDFEIETIRKKGLAKGGGLENTIVIGLDKIHNENKLKFKDEFVRHKILDFLGDIYLLGYQLKAHIIAVRTGHQHNINFAKKIAERNLLKNE
jgi:UDP-3-O-acyl N-acetylglucosamine deacetylase